jgi:hypothetical protein
VKRIRWRLLGLGLALLPPIVEAEARARLADRRSQAEIDLLGLTLHDVERQVGPVQFHADSVRIQLELAGIRVKVKGLDAKLLPPLRSKPIGSGNLAEDLKSGISTPSHATPPFLVTIESEGHLSWEGPAGIKARLDDPMVVLGPNGTIGLE